MKYKLLAGLLAATVTAGCFSVAQADTFFRTIDLQNNSVGIMPINEINVGDDVRLQLINSSNERLTFQTTQQFGDEARFVVNPRTVKTVEFEYNRPFEESVNYAVYNTNGEPVNKFVLINIDSGKELNKDIFHKELTLSLGEHDFSFEELGKGETVVLHLRNNSSEDYLINIEDDERLTRDERLVPANTNKNITFEYPNYFGDEVELSVARANSTSTQNANTIDTSHQMKSKSTSHAHAYESHSKAKDMTGWNGTPEDTKASHSAHAEMGSRHR